MRKPKKEPQIRKEPKDKNSIVDMELYHILKGLKPFIKNIKK